VDVVGSGSLPVNTNNSSKGPNIGAIVGGVIGGVAFIAIVVFCIWKFWLKGRRHEVEIEEEWEDDEEDGPEKSNASVFTREARSRASTHTVASMASTVLTRASNIIQIAYIPGVTNRSNGTPSGNDILVPPVPPIPSAVGTPSSTNSRFSDQLLFMPGDLRDSTYSDMSSITDAHRRPGSIAPSLARTSMASTIFRDSAVINPMPATQIIGGKAAIVSVGSKGTPGSTPPVPSVDFAKHSGKAVKPVMVKMPSSSSEGSGSATSSLKTMKPVALNIIRAKPKPAADTVSLASVATAKSSTADERRMTKQSIAPSELSVDTHRRARQSGMTHRSSRMTTYSDLEDDEDEHERGRQSLLDTKVPPQSPFSDAAEAKTPPGSSGGASLKPSIVTVGGAKKEEVVERGKSPFDDPEDIAVAEKKS
jgi:hypothetical protein